MNCSEIIERFLGVRAREFVRQVTEEWRRYEVYPDKKAIAGCLQRDAVRFRLVRLAHHRYSQKPAKHVIRL